MGLRLPPDTAHAKGFVGQLVERALGGTAENRPEPDFEILGIELKTVPVAAGRIRESTFICTAPLGEMDEMTWEESPLRHKTRRILWVPVEADEDLPLGVRRIGWPLMWSPDAETDQKLEADWTRCVEVLKRQPIRTERGETLDAALDPSWGDVVQLRPKGRNARSRVRLADGSLTGTRGFYFRRRFVQALFDGHYAAD